MSLYHVNKSKKPTSGFKCTACGYLWTTADSKLEKCPKCGYHCNPYTCQAVSPAQKDSQRLDQEKQAAEGYKCVACGYKWTSGDTTTHDKCPVCGYKCNPYSCQVITTEHSKDNK